VATTAQTVVDRARILIGDIASKATDDSADLVWDDTQLAVLLPTAMLMTVDYWPQEYSCGSLLTDEVSPDPAASGDVAAVSMFLAKAALLAEQTRWARRAIVHSGVGGSTNMRLITESISKSLDRIDTMLEAAYSSRAHEAVAADMVAREAKTETADSDQTRPAVKIIVSA
jgi:hypothetical protein